MKLQVTQENLNKALGTVSRVASGRNTLPILSNVLLKTEANRLSIAATNLDIAITHYLGSKVSEEGSITVPARLMQDFVNSLPNSVIDLNLEDHKLHITTEQYNSVINGVSAEEFPVMPAITKGITWKIKSSELKHGLAEVIIAASADETRPALTGVYFHTHEGRLFIVATDSYRLAEKELIKTDKEISLLIPASAMHDLLRILNDTDEEVTVTHDDQQVLFKTGDVELVTRLIEGKYPDYRKLIPEAFEVVIQVSRPELINITKVSSLFARESAGSITLNASDKDKTVSIKSIASQLGENTASASASVKGAGSITLNSRYLLDALNSFSGEDINFCFNGKLDAVVLRDSKESGHLHLIMPLKS
jgi:DNA polymerase-3 subunit beta